MMQLTEKRQVMTCQHRYCDASLDLWEGWVLASTIGDLRQWAESLGWQTYRPRGWASAADYCPEHHRA